MSVSIAEQLTELKPDAPPEQAGATDGVEAGPIEDVGEQLRKRVVFSFAGTMALALAVSGLYIGAKIVAARPAPRIARFEREAAVKTAESIVVPTVAATNPKPVPPERDPAASARSLLNPAETYVQVASLPRALTDSYVAGLKSKGFHPIIAPGPTQGTDRVLFGPFRDGAALEREKGVLNAAHIQWFLRSYPDRATAPQS